MSFHGSLDTPNPEDARAIKARVLVCHGSIDPHVTPESLRGFVDEMETADRRSWQHMQLIPDQIPQ